MDDTMRVQVVKRMNKLLSYLSDFVLWKTSIVFKNLKKFALSKLGDHTKLMLSLKAIKKQDYILMVEAF